MSGVDREICGDALDDVATSRIGIAPDDMACNAHGAISDDQRRRLQRQRSVWIAGTLGFVVVLIGLLAALILKLINPSFADRGQLWITIPVALLWLWLLRSCFGQWRQANRDLREGRVATIDGVVRCEWQMGLGVIQLPRYQIHVDDRMFRVDGRTFFQFKNHDRYRIVFAPHSGLLFGAIALGDVRSVEHVQPAPTIDADVPVAPINSAPVVIEPLTPQEQTIVRLIAQGLSNKEIGAELSLSTNTIKMYTSQVYRKLGVRRRTEAVARARQLGIL